MFCTSLAPFFRVWHYWFTFLLLGVSLFLSFFKINTFALVRQLLLMEISVLAILLAFSISQLFSAWFSINNVSSLRWWLGGWWSSPLKICIGVKCKRLFTHHFVSIRQCHCFDWQVLSTDVLAFLFVPRGQVLSKWPIKISSLNIPFLIIMQK